VNHKNVKRAKRVAAFMAASGLLAPGAGNWFGIDALASAAFGAVLVGVSLVATLLLIYAGRGYVEDAAFDKAINEQIEQIQSKKKD
jgi:hypothetical protein